MSAERGFQNVRKGNVSGEPWTESGSAGVQGEVGEIVELVEG